MTNTTIMATELVPPLLETITSSDVPQHPLRQNPPNSEDAGPFLATGLVHSTELLPPPSQRHRYPDNHISPRAKPFLLQSGSDDHISPEINESSSNDIENPERTARRPGEEGGWHMRHGWDSQYGPEQLHELSSNFYMYFNDKRHETTGNTKVDYSLIKPQDWRMRDRLKTISALLAVCLNVGTDPPDVIKPNPCARFECWIDPAPTYGPPGISPMNQIGKALQTQYEQLSMRTRYKVSLDPTAEEIKKYCTQLRKNAKDERLLFHYNGHGVPKPTSSGEIWAFNKTYTQYLPVALFDLRSWLGAPSLFVYDCSSAGLIIDNFNKLAERQEVEAGNGRADQPAQPTYHSDFIHLGACGKGEALPTNPILPADLFTSCLTTPVDIAIRFFILRNPLPNNLRQEDVLKIPGRSSERRTPIGELNWIFTAITDTIAWNCLPKPLFKKLFRQDLMVAALFRNFLSAQRIMRTYGCHPQSYPEIPQTHDHPLWNSWDLAVEMVLAQLPDLLRAERKEIEYEYKHSDFFSEQLTAFQIYLSQGAVEQKEPEQLPIVLQVLLSQVHRLRALILLSKFLDLGPWAVNLALGIGIFPYVLKLLQSQAVELKPVMVFIWARILAVDQNCQSDLLKDNGYQYFVSIFNPSAPGMPIREISQHKAMCAFIIAMFCKDFKQGRMVAHNPDLIQSCIDQTAWHNVDNPLLRQWACLCLSLLWKDFPEAKWSGIRAQAHLKLCEAVLDPVPEVRTAMIYALTTFIGIPDLTEQVAQIEEGVASRLIVMSTDGSSLVRKELVIFFSAFVARNQDRFIVTAYEQMSGELKQLQEKHLISSTNGISHDEDFETLSAETVYGSLWKHILIMAVDPHPDVSQLAVALVDYVLTSLLQSSLGSLTKPVLEELQKYGNHSMPNTFDSIEHNLRNASAGPPSPLRPQAAKQDGYFSSVGVIKRTASVAASLKNLAFGPATPVLESPGGDHQSLPRQGLSDRAATGRTRPATDRVKPAEESILPLPIPHRSAKSPMPKLFKPRETKEKTTLPFESTFFDWSIEYFREPQMKANEADEPGSTDYNERLWRRNRNEWILDDTQKQKEHAGSSRWDKTLGVFDNGAQPMQMCFHQYDAHLAVANEHDTVRIWNWERQRSLNRFSNGNAPGTVITGMRFINEDDQALLMTGSTDGTIKMFRDYDSHDRVHLVSALRALTDMVPSTHNAGLVFDWLQGRGRIIVAGDAKVIRVWNAATETCTNDIPARSGSCVTSLTSDQVEGNIVVAGFGDGAVRVYDQRERSNQSMQHQWKEHTSWITNVHMQRGGQRELVTGCRNGEVKLWDLRMDKSLRTIRVTKDTLRSLTVHEHAPVFAAGSERHSVKIYNMDGAFLSSLEPYGNYLHQGRNAPISATAFHPHRMVLACGAVNDNHVNLFSCSDAPVIKQTHVPGMANGP